MKPICVNSGDTEYTCKTFRDTPVTYKRQYIKLTGVNDKSDISRQHGLPLDLGYEYDQVVIEHW